MLVLATKTVGGMYLRGMANVKNYNNNGGTLLCKVMYLQLCMWKKIIVIGKLQKIMCT